MMPFHNEKSNHLLLGGLLGTTVFFLTMNMNIPVAAAIAWWGRWAMLLGVISVGFIQEKNTSRLRMGGLDLALFVMILLYLPSVLFAHNEASFQKNGLYLLFYVFELFTLIRWTKRLPLQSWLVLVIFFAGMILFGAGLALVGVVSMGGVEGRLGAGMAGRNANSVGVSCMTGLLLMIPLLFLSTKWRWFFRFSFLIPLGVLYLSGSRSSLGGLFIGMFFSFWALRKLKFVAFASIFLIGIWATYFLFFSTGPERQKIIDDFKGRVVRGETREEQLSTRQGNWDECLYNWRERPTIGWGFSSTGPESDRPIDGAGYHGLLASVGVLGAMGFGIQALTLFSLAWKYKRRKFSTLPDEDYHNPRWLFAVGIGLCTGFLVQGIGEPWQIGIGSLMTFGYIIGLAAVSASFYRQDRERRNSGNPFVA